MSFNDVDNRNPAADYIWCPQDFIDVSRRLPSYAEDPYFPVHVKPGSIVACSCDIFAGVNTDYADCFYALALLRSDVRFLWYSTDATYARNYFYDVMYPYRACVNAAAILEVTDSKDTERINRLRRGASMFGVTMRQNLFPNVTAGLYFPGRLPDRIGDTLDSFGVLPVESKYYWFGRLGSVFRFSPFTHRPLWIPKATQSQTDCVDLVQSVRRSIEWIVCEADDAKRGKLVYDQCADSGTPLWMAGGGSLPREMRMRAYPISWNKEPKG